MSIYLQNLAVFAKLDMLSGEDLYGEHFGLKETEAINDEFDRFGADNMIMITNSGSFFIVCVLLILAFFLYFLAHKVTVRYARNSFMRRFGMWLEDKTYFANTLSALEKLVIESHFDLSLAVCIGNYGFRYYNLEFVQFF
jgi:hypothetical protein